MGLVRRLDEPVVYLRRDPSVARLADDPVPRDGLEGMLVDGLFLLAFGVSLVWGVLRKS
jgi:hypothetical protein